MDETDCSGEHGERSGFWGAAAGNNGGIRGTTRHENGRHMTASTINNTAWDVLHPFFILAGLKKMASWVEPLPASVFKNECGAAQWMTAGTGQNLVLHSALREQDKYDI